MEKIIWSSTVTFIINFYCIILLIQNKSILEIKSVLGSN